MKKFDSFSKAIEYASTRKGQVSKKTQVKMTMWIDSGSVKTATMLQGMNAAFSDLAQLTGHFGYKVKIETELDELPEWKA